MFHGSLFEMPNVLHGGWVQGEEEAGCANFKRLASRLSGCFRATFFFAPAFFLNGCCHQPTKNDPIQPNLTLILTLAQREPTQPNSTPTPTPTLTITLNLTEEDN